MFDHLSLFPALEETASRQASLSQSDLHIYPLAEAWPLASKSIWKEVEVKGCGPVIRVRWRVIGPVAH